MRKSVAVIVMSGVVLTGVGVLAAPAQAAPAAPAAFAAKAAKKAPGKACKKKNQTITTASYGKLKCKKGKWKMVKSNNGIQNGMMLPPAIALPSAGAGS